MAQRTIHMLLALMVSQRTKIKDPARFFLGNLLPDSFSLPENRKKAHFIKHIESENTVYFDFHAFFEKYKRDIAKDDLYLGYYAHLVTDAFYRYFIYYEKDFMSRVSRADLTIMHEDYNVLNAYINEKYNLPADIKVPEDFRLEKINDITEFRTEEFIEEYRNDLRTPAGGRTRLLTESMLDEFVDSYLYGLINELECAMAGETVLDPKNYKWENKK